MPVVLFSAGDEKVNSENRNPCPWVSSISSRCVYVLAVSARYISCWEQQLSLEKGKGKFRKEGTFLVHACNLHFLSHVYV